MDEKYIRKITELEQKIAALQNTKGKPARSEIFKKLNIIIGVTIALVVTSFLIYATQITFTDGTIISAGEVNNNFNELYAESANMKAKVNCRNTFWEFSDGRLCMEKTRKTSTAPMYTAQAVCGALAPGCRVCTLSDIMIAHYQDNSLTLLYAGDWLGDHTADDKYLYVNNASNYSNIDGESDYFDNRAYRCCY
jgi:hypothetical protein